MEENLRPLRLRPWSPKQTTGATHSLYLPDALWAKLCTQAEREGRSVSALVSAIVGGVMAEVARGQEGKK